MSRNRIYIEEPIKVGDEIVVRGDRAHYVSRVLRLKPDDMLILFDGSGAEFPAAISALARDRIDVSILDRLERSAESPLAITLLQGISRGERMDYVIQKATEVGVTRIIPVKTEFSVVKLDEKRARKRLLHWRSVAASACEQCGRNRLPEVDLPASLPALLGVFRQRAGTKLILRPDAERTLGSAGIIDNDVVVLIGPEGGFSDIEHENAEAAGFSAARCGPRILRTETAAVAVLAALQALYGDLA